MKNRNIIKQNYQLVNAKYKLNSSEMKFILNALTQIDTKDKILKEYEIKVSDLEEKLQVKQNETRLKQFAKKLLSKPLEVPTKNGWLIANWFAEIEYIKGEAKFKVTISEKLKPYLLELKYRFVTCNLKYILPLKSNYSIRIYQILKEYEKLTKRTFTIEELQEILQVPKSFKIYNRFKEKVLKIAEKELIENCDIFFEYEEIKTGKKVTKILFRIKPSFENKEKIEEKEKFLFKMPEKKYEKYINRKLTTAQGTKTIIFVKEGQYNTLEVHYLGGNFSKVKNVNELDFILGDINEKDYISREKLEKILKKKFKKLTAEEINIIKKELKD